MNNNELVIRYGYEKQSKMILKLDQTFPRNKTWLNGFEKLILRYCPERESILEQMIEYLKGVKIPGLPKELEKLDGQIEAAHERVKATQPKSYAREDAEWIWRSLKSRKARWPKYVEQHTMNLELLEQFMRG